MNHFHPLNWRYVIKRTGRLTTEKSHYILESIRASGSRFGLLPNTVSLLDKHLHVQRIFPESFYPQLSQSSHLIVFSAYHKIMHENIDDLIAHIALSNNLCLDDREDYKETMKLLVKVPQESHLKWCTEQAYIALGLGLTLAAEHNIDVTPVEDFDHETVDKIMGLQPQGLKSVLILAMGKRDETSESPGKPVQPKRQMSFLVN